MTPISGWDFLDAALQSLPLAVVVYLLALIVVGASPNLLTSNDAIYFGLFVAALQFAYVMNQQSNPRYSSIQTNGLGSPSKSPQG